jgi:hypothetical protein
MAGKWSRLFPAGEYRWSIGLRPGDVRAFFARTEANADLLAERKRWLEEMPGECALLTEEGVPLLDEAMDLAREWDRGTLDQGDANVAGRVDALQCLGRAWEADFVLLTPKDDGMTVEGGVVCFPSAWALREKLGRTLEFTHSVVPELNAQLAARIQKVLSQLAPGAAWERENWGLSRDAERNHFVHRSRRRLDPSIQPTEVWLRIERQVLMKMPRTGGILFGIRLEIVPWLEVVADPDAREGLGRALASMPPAAAEYKGLGTARDVLLEWLSVRV